MSAQSAAAPQLVIPITEVVVRAELLPPGEVCTAPNGVVTESFGPTQVVLHHAHVLTPLNFHTLYDISAAKPHHFNTPNMRFIRPLAGGSLLFQKI